MFYEVDNGIGQHDSFGFAPITHGSAWGDGKIYEHDNTNYTTRAYTNTISITEEQYHILYNFGKDPKIYHFSTYYRGESNSCIDFVWKALEVAGIANGFEGEVWPTWNIREVARLFRISNHLMDANTKLLIDADTAYNQALIDVHARAALVAGNNFYNVSDNIADPSKFDIYDPITGQGTLTKAYLKDRADYLAHRAQGDYDSFIAGSAGDGNVYVGASLSDTLDTWTYHDENETGSLIYAPYRSKNHYVIFGSEDASEVIEGGNQSDHLYGMGGIDNINGNAGNDYIEGGDGDDVLHGNADSDTLLGMSGNDLLFGDEGNDSLDGGADADKLDGGAGHDTLVGGTGDDTLIGDKGNDALMGGKGADTYILKTADGGFGADSIWDEDGNGTIIIDNQPITGTPKQINDHLWQFDLPDGRRVMTVVINNGSDLIGTTAIYTTNIDALQIKIVRQFAIYN